MQKKETETPFVHDTIVGCDTLFQWQQHLKTNVMVFDCSFDLALPEAGQSAFEQESIPGAHYVHLDFVLSSQDANKRASGGRHPLPLREDFAAWLESKGFTNTMQAVVYDRNGGMFCGRMWWMLKWLGHEAVAVLDGGLRNWQAKGYPVQAGVVRAAPPQTTPFNIKPPLVQLVDASAVEAQLACAGSHNGAAIVDARAAPRYQGALEPIDPVAGHIPGAYNRPFTENFDSLGFYKSADVLREEFNALLKNEDAVQPHTIIHHCGSGVSAIPNVLAMQIAGLEHSALYAGSWSDWVSVRGRPVNRGSER